MVADRRPPAVARVLTQVTTTVRRHGLVRPGGTVLASVSGGPDSVCLLYTLWYLRRLLKIRIEVFHFDHGLRADSRDDARYVRRICDRLRVPIHVRTATEAPRRGMSVEAWATSARTSAADDVRRAILADVVAEGHTLDDQAETVLLNLIRGSSLEGVAGIDPGGLDAALVQPMLDVTRDEVEAFCRALHLRPRRDPMNEDPRFLRAAIRDGVLPLLEASTGRGVRRAIVRTSDNLRRDRDELYASGLQAFTRLVDRADPDLVRIDAAGLAALPPSLAARVARLVAYDVLATDAAAPWSKPAIEALLDLAAGRPGRRRDLPDGMVARRDRTHVVVERARGARG
jgi:tRNA(Ile)-lysidine synthase